MGNAVTCFSPSPTKTKRLPPFSRSTSKTRDTQFSDEVIRRHAVAAALRFQQHQKHNSLPSFTRSASANKAGSNKRESGVKNQSSSFGRSASTRPASDSDSLLQPRQLVNDQGGDGRCRFVLVHGGGFGAWCWYKTMSLLRDEGFEVTAVDLAGSGVHLADPNSISNLSEYVKPLVDVLREVEDTEKVILVGHDLGGACVSYVAEMMPLKVAKAVYVAAAMVADGQSCLDVFSMQVESNKRMLEAQSFVYGRGSDHAPTAIEYNKADISTLLFNQCTSKDVALSSVSMRQIPLAPVKEKLTLTSPNYGSVRRFYIQTLDDLALQLDLQDSMINLSPPERVFKLKGADHAPFFSKPQSLHKLLVEISNIT